MKFFSALFVLLFLVSFSAFAEMYEWVDNKGVVNFTDNPDNIPAKYRKKVKKRPSINFEEDKAEPAGSEKTQPSPKAVSAPAKAKAKLVGGHDEEWWHSRYSSLRKEMKEINDSLPGKREELVTLRRKMTIYQGARDRKAYYDKMAEIENDESRLKELGGQLDSLDFDASKVGVPLDWRK